MNRQFTPASPAVRTVFAAAAVVVALSTLTFIDSLAQSYGAAWQFAQEAQIEVAKR